MRNAKLCQAVGWLAIELVNGPQQVTELVARAARTDISKMTLRRAKAALGAKAKQAKQSGSHPGWTWELPSAIGPSRGIKSNRQAPPLVMPLSEYGVSL